MAARASFPKIEFGTAHARDVTFDPITRNPCDLIGLAIFVTRSRMRTSIFRLFYLISYAEEFQNRRPYWKFGSLRDFKRNFWLN